MSDDLPSFYKSLTVDQQKEMDIFIGKAKKTASLENKLQAVSRRMAIASHELRNPLNGIIGLSELLQEPDITPSERKEFLTVIESSGYTLLELIETEISEITSAPKMTSFQLLDSVSHAATRLYPGVRKRDNLTYTVSTVGENYHVLGVNSYLQEIVGNLTDNALKYTEEGNIDFYAETIPLANNRVGLHMQVSDTGLGIKPQDREKVLRGTQINIPISTKYKTSGVGLPRIADIIHRMDGDLTIGTNAPHGTIFTVQLAYELSSITYESSKSQ